MTSLVLLVILYHASFWFARGAEKKIANQKECSVAERGDGILVIVVAAVKNGGKRASERSIQMLRSDTYFVLCCTDGLITRKKQELTQHERHTISAIIFLRNDLHNAQRHGSCIETATRMSRRLLHDYRSGSFLFRLLRGFRYCS